jgi:dipeptidyl aminopeptidase/acylaminoacyl peptidase
VRTGPRHVVWSAHGGARLVWLEALDGGDPRTKVTHRDKWMELAAPFDAAPREILRLEHRASGLSWMHDPRALLARDYDRDRRWTRLRLFGANGDVVTLDDRSARDRYGDPGSILFEPAMRGRRIVRQRGEWIFRSGEGDTPEGPRPFLDRQSLATLATERMFHSATDAIESPATLIDDDAGVEAAQADSGCEPRMLVTHHESSTSPPNLRLRKLGHDAFERLTHFEDPAPILRELTKESLVYTRDDGVKLSGDLYLPPKWNGERLPVVLWAYPHDYVDTGTASQTSAAKNRFTRVGGPSQIFFALLGYAVLDDASMPIVGDPETMNDTFLEQAVSSARAAIDELDRRGVGDRARVGVGGHSYGAFMTACLLAHSDLFKAGIARSGAYNRTLTPFGFQAERRTLWEARDSYLKLSPFLNAHTIKAPLLLIHGEKDENPGTHPLQSERLFHAIKGTGGTARYVTLPHEGHGYRARESVLHVLAEQIEWFDRYVKQ